MSIFDINEKNNQISVKYLMENGWVLSTIRYIDRYIQDTLELWTCRIIINDKYSYMQKNYWLGYSFQNKILYNLTLGVKLYDITDILDLEIYIHSIRNNQFNCEFNYE